MHESLHNKIIRADKKSCNIYICVTPCACTHTGRQAKKLTHAHALKSKLTCEVSDRHELGAGRRIPRERREAGRGRRP